MKLATLRKGSSTSAVRVSGDSVVEISGYASVGELLREGNWRAIAESANGQSHVLSEIAPKSWAPVIPNPSKIICVGLNYRDHAMEMGHTLPDFPTLFNKYPEALIGPFDDLHLPEGASDAVDWETELAVVIGKSAYRLSESEAENYIAGYSIMNDVTLRDYQSRTSQWLQGKSHQATAPFGPWLVLAEDFEMGNGIGCEINGTMMQQSTTDQQIFTPVQLVSYISNLFTLNPGDVIITGTPSGIGHARKPAVYLKSGDVMVSVIEGIGRMENAVASTAPNLVI